jgi:hypothetical protein
MTTDFDPLAGLCADLQAALGGSQEGADPDEIDTWPWACRILLLRGLLATGRVERGDVLDLVAAGDDTLGRVLPPLRPRTRGEPPPRAALERGVALLFDGSDARPSRDELDRLLGEPGSLGRAHQVWGAARRSRIYKRALARREVKIAGRDVVRVTQLYTPKWMSSFLVRGTLGARLAERAAGRVTFVDPACGTGNVLLEAFDVLFDAYRRAGTDAVAACHEVLEHDLFGLDIDPDATDVAASEVWRKVVTTCGEELDVAARVVCLERLGEVGSLLDPARRLEQIEWPWVVPGVDGVDGMDGVDDGATLRPSVPWSTKSTLSMSSTSVAWASSRASGALDLLSRQYDVVVTNPPYLSNRQMGGELRRFVRLKYPTTAADLYACFIERVERMTVPGGLYGLVCPMGWTTLSAFEEFRQAWLRRNTITSFVSAGQGAFPEAELLFIGLVTARRSPPDEGSEIRAVRRDSELHAHEVRISQLELMSNPGSVLTFFMPPKLGKMLRGDGTTLGDLADVVAGIDTGENARFVRYAWELDGQDPGRWAAYSKGKGYCHWVGDQDTRVDWEHEGARIRRQPGATIRNEPFFFLRGLECSYVYGGKLSCRVLEPSIPDHGSVGVFPRDEADLPVILALLNSRLGTMLGRSLSPTLNMPVGALKRMPFPRAIGPDRRATIGTLVRKCVDLKTWLRDSPLIERPPRHRWRKVAAQAIRARIDATAELLQHEAAIEVELHSAFGLDPAESAEVLGQTGGLAERSDATATDRALAEELVMAIVLRLLGVRPAAFGRTVATDPRWPEAAAVVPLTRGTALEPLIDRIRRALAWVFPADDPDGVERDLGAALGMPLESWLHKRLFARHARTYRSRPVLWQVRSRPARAKATPAISCILAYRSLSRDTARSVLTQLVSPLRASAPPEAGVELDDFAARLERVIRDGFGAGRGTDPDLADGVRVNIAPWQLAGLLACPVLTDEDAARAIEDRERWRHDETGSRGQG